MIATARNIGSVWRYRHFWGALVRNDLRLRYRGSALGIGWSLLNPIALTATFCVIFSSWQGLSNWRYDAIYFIGGLAVWDFISLSIIAGCQTFFKNEPFIRQSPLPMGIYPLRTVLGCAIHSLITLGVVIIGAGVLLGQGWGAASLIPMVLPGALLLLLFGWGVCVVAGFVNVFFQDTQHIAEVILRIFFFLTPILFKEELLVQKQLQWLGDYNPVVLFFDLIRAPILTGEMPEARLYLNACGLVAVTGAAAALVIRWLERKLVFHL